MSRVAGATIKTGGFDVSARLSVEAAPIRIRSKRLQQPVAIITQVETESAAARQNSQLPGFAPLLEELEVAGWSSHRRALSGNFHDWMLLERRTLLVMLIRSRRRWLLKARGRRFGRTLSMPPMRARFCR